MVDSGQSINLAREEISELTKLRALKELATGKRASRIGEIIKDLLELKAQLSYYPQANRKLAGMSSHNKKAESKRKRTIKKKNKKRRR